MTAIAEELLRRGITPEIFVSGNAEGGEANNAKIMEKIKNRVPFI